MPPLSLGGNVGGWSSADAELRDQVSQEHVDQVAEDPQPGAPQCVEAGRDGIARGPSQLAGGWSGRCGASAATASSTAATATARAFCSTHGAMSAASARFSSQMSSRNARRKLSEPMNCRVSVPLRETKLNIVFATIGMSTTKAKIRIAGATRT